MTNTELQVLLEACKAAGIPPHEVRPDNPFTHSGTPRSKMIQVAVESINPAQAAAWRVEAGGSISLATAAAEAQLIPHTQETRADLFRHNPTYVTQKQQEQSDWEANQLKAMDEAWRKSYEARTGQSADDYDRPNFALHGKFANSMERRWIHDKLANGDQV